MQTVDEAFNFINGSKDSISLDDLLAKFKPQVNFHFEFSKKLIADQFYTVFLINSRNIKESNSIKNRLKLS